MLVLTRKAGESILIGDDIRITVTALSGGRVRIGIDAPPQVPVDRDEIAKPHIVEEERPAETDRMTRQTE